jgi:IS1 family transposase
MNKLATADRVRVIAALVEGCSIRATVRIPGVAKNTVVKLLANLGTACSAYHDQHVRGLTTKRIQCDEIWSFCYAKAKNVPAEKKGQFGYGDVWTWTALDADSKLMVGYMLGTRDSDTARAFMSDVAERVTSRVQVTTDGHSSYFDTVGDAFNWDVDYTMLIKIYGPNTGGSAGGKYSPPPCIGVKHQPICGNPDPKHISTSFVERQNLTMRMGMRRFTRLTNAFSKKLENHASAIALHFMHYNFCRVHQTLRVTPAMAAGLADHVWELDELVALLG